MALDLWSLATNGTQEGQARQLAHIGSNLADACSLGGTIGALLGMQVWRHKTMHLKFKYGLPLILLPQIALMYLISEK